MLNVNPPQRHHTLSVVAKEMDVYFDPIQIAPIPIRSLYARLGLTADEKNPAKG